MKFITVLIAIIVLAGCTTMKPVEMSSDQLHDRIAAGDVVSQGDKVKIVTTDGKTHKFKVAAVSDVSILGDDTEVPIADIVAIETSEFSGGKTAALTGSMVLVYVLLAALAAASFSMGY